MKKLFNEIGGCCPFCGNKTNIIEGCVYDYSLNEQGVPEYINEEQYKITCYCKHCMTSLFVMPNSGGYKVYPTDPWTSPYNNYISKSRMSVIGNIIMNDKNNPFLNSSNSESEVPNDNNTELESEDIPF